MFKPVSASQVLTFRLCPRKWYYQSILGFRPPPTKNQQLGIYIHKELEIYFRTGEMPKNPIALAGIVYLPERHPNLLIEHEIKMATYDGGPSWTGIVDLVVPHNKIPLVLDHKTTSDFMYVKTKEDLQEDVQMGAYAHWAVEKFSSSSAVLVQHVYYRTRGAPASISVDTEISLAQIATVWKGILESVREMEITAECGVEDVEGNEEACNAFGGCPHRFRCSIKAKGRILKIMGTGNGKSRLADMLGAKKGNDVLQAALGTQKSTEKAAPVGVLPPDMPLPPTMPVTEIEAKPEGKKRGRPAKVAVDTSTAGEAPLIITSGVSVETTLRPTLFIDCIPTKGISGWVLLEDFIAPLAQQVGEDSGLEDYRLAQYGAGSALLATKIRAIKDLPAVIICNSMEPAAKIALEVLVPKAGLVVRGLRG